MTEDTLLNPMKSKYANFLRTRASEDISRAVFDAGYKVNQGAADIEEIFKAMLLALADEIERS